MKKSAFIFCLGILSAALLPAQNTQTRQYILDKLVIFYIPDASAAMPTGTALQALEVNSREIFNGNDLTDAWWTNANNTEMVAFLKKLLRAPGTAGGDAKLQRITRNELMITGKKVKVYLYNDIALTGTRNASWTIYCQGGSNYPSGNGNKVWPCANVITGTADTTDFTGHMALGNYFFKNYSADLDWKFATFLHELSHSQLSVDNRAGLPSGIAMYGSDALHHTYDELIPGYNIAFNEGLANGFAFRYHLGGNGMSAWFNNNNNVYVDDISCTSASQTYCLQQRLAALTPAVTGTAGTVNGHAVKIYKIKDIPAPILMYNENEYANIFYQFMQQFQSGEYMLSSAVKNCLPNLRSTTGRPFGYVYKELVKKGMNFRHSRLPAGEVTHGQHLPLAILDYYTGYKLTDKAALEACIGSTWNATDTNIDSYFSSKRNVFLGNSATPPTDWQVRYIDRFAEHLNVKVSAAAATSGTAPSGN